MEIVIASYDDWEGLYINDHLVTQSHNITVTELAEEIIKRLPRMNMTFEKRWVDGNWMSDRSDLPQELKKVKFENG